MVLLRLKLFVLLFFSLGCQIPYLTKTAYNHLSLMSRRVEIDEAIKTMSLNEEQVRKLNLALEARKFAEKELGLKTSKNYTQFVQLDRPYVSYVVSAAPKYELKPHKWWFPIVGHVPYKGYASPEEAKEEAKNFDKAKYDTYIRGAGAYSTLGWFKDPILSSHLTYSDHDLVNLIIHETVHVTIYIKSNASFNERLATFIGNKGTELYYQKKEGEKSKTVSLIQKELYDDKLFSDYISKTVNDLDRWYKENKNNMSLEKRNEKLSRVQNDFKTNVQPKFKVYKMSHFAKEPLNNAKILSYKTYVYDMSDFENAFKKLDSDFKKFVEWAKTLEKEKDPEAALKKFSTSDNTVML